MKITLIILMMLCAFNSNAQGVEELAERTETEIEEDTSAIHINLNTATIEDLDELVNPIQAEAFIQYRNLLGKLVNIYELQAVPYWDLATIQRILPYISIAEPEQKINMFKGNGSLALRYAPQKFMLRYRYNYKNRLQYGLLTDKDPGEKLLDFYSFHVFIRKPGSVQCLAIGDFTVNMGQGLIQWQSLSLGKSSELTSAKKQSAILRPYTSTGEYNFHRGMGMSLRRKNLSATAFASFRKLDANLATDSINRSTVITSFITSGSHRHNVTQQTLGGNLAYDRTYWHLGANFIHYNFSYPIQKRNEPYNLFAFRGRQLFNYSVDYDYTFQNIHGFGEIAFSQPGGLAMVHGLFISLDKKVDASIVARHIQPRFQSLYAAAFTENSLPSNESGILMGLALKPARAFLLNIYADVFRFPWLRSRANAPSTGHEYLLQLNYTPHKKLEMITRLRFKCKEENYRVDGDQFNVLTLTTRTNWRMHINWQPSPAVLFRQRVEIIWFNKNKAGAEQGYLLYQDLGYKPPGSPCRFGARLEFFETNGFNSRLYAFENDFTSGYAVRAVYHKGWRYYVNLEMDFGHVKTTHSRAFFIPQKAFIRWSHTIHETEVGTAFQGLDVPEFKMQLIFSML